MGLRGGRGPSRRPAPRSPADMCTTVPPAKSSTPSLCRNPSGCQVQCASGAVDEQAEQAHEQQVAREPHPLGERAGDQRRRDDRELQLEQREERPAESSARDPGASRRRRAVNMKKVQRVADHAVDAVAERQAEADHDPEQADDRPSPRSSGASSRRRSSCGPCRRRRTRGPGVISRTSAGGRQHPGDVAGVDRSAGDRLRRRRMDDGAEQG